MSIQYKITYSKNITKPKIFNFSFDSDVIFVTMNVIKFKQN